MSIPLPPLTPPEGIPVLAIVIALPVSVKVILLPGWSLTISVVPSLPTSLISEAVPFCTDDKSYVVLSSEGLGNVTVLTFTAVGWPVASWVTESITVKLAPAAGDTAEVVSVLVVLSWVTPTSRLLIFVVILTFYHFYLGGILSQFKIYNNKHSHKFFRYINEIPTILLILIIFIVIFKPI